MIMGIIAIIFLKTPNPTGHTADERTGHRQARGTKQTSKLSVHKTKATDKRTGRLSRHADKRTGHLRALGVQSGGGGRHSVAGKVVQTSELIICAYFAREDVRGMEVWWYI